MKEQRPRYPKLKEVLGHLRQKTRLSATDLHQKTGIPESTLYSFFRGVRKPSDDSIAKLANALARGTETVRDVTNALESASRPHEPPPSLEDILSGERKLQAISVRFPPFADKEGSAEIYSWQLYERLFRHLGLEEQIEHIQGVRGDLHQLEAQLVRGNVDLVLNYLCTPPRLRRLVFLLTTIRVGLNACCMASRASHIEKLQAAILGREVSDLRIKLIVVNWGVAAWYARAISSVTAQDIIEVPDLSIRELAAKLQELEREDETATVTTIPVVLATEPTALGVAAVLGNAARMVFRLSTNSDRKFLRGELPEYAVGIALKRDNTELQRFLQEGLNYYLLTNAEAIARTYAHLYTEFYDRAYAALEQTEPKTGLVARQAREYARYTLRLDTDSVSKLAQPLKPWANVLRTARVYVRASAAKNRVKIKEELLARLRQWIVHSPSELRDRWAHGLREQLERDFDVELPADAEPPAIAEEIVSRIQHALFQQEPSGIATVVFPIAAEQSDPTVQKQLEKLSKEYEDEQREYGILTDKKPVKDFDCIARFVARREHDLIGTAFLRWEPKKADQLPTHELRIHVEHIFVRYAFRGTHVGQRIIWESLRKASAEVAMLLRDSGAIHRAAVFVRSDRLTPHANGWFNKLGFTKDKNNPALLCYWIALFPEETPRR